VDAAFQELKRRLAEVYDVGKALGVLAWDQRTQMPPGGAPARAEQLGTLSRIAHELFVSEEIGRLLEELRSYEGSLDYDSDEASLIRMTRRDYEKASRVPADLSAEMSRAAALAQHVWEQARRDSDYESFRPHLEKNLELRRRYVACFEPAAEDYDVLLDDYEPGMTTAEVRATFDTLKAGLVPLIEEIREREPAVDDSFLHGDFPVERQHEFEREVLSAFGFTSENWRMDETVHPFASNSSPDDIRLTTRHHEDSLSSVFATMHEFGHGLYEHGVDRSLDRTPLARGASLGLHESQSRTWENLVGRSLPFWQHFYPRLQGLFPAQLGGVDVDGFYRAVNRVRPSLIRIEADEATYNLHVILRFELEQDLLAGTIDLRDLPEAWDAKVLEYLGIEVPDVADGVLQDTHWASGHLGYFPTYSLGNVISLQIWERLRLDLPDVDKRIGHGEFGPLREWLREHLHRSGRKFMPGETLERVVGTGLDPGPYMHYLRVKLGAIYGLA
jgi:carboxypeptidase Taq